MEMLLPETQREARWGSTPQLANQEVWPYPVRDVEPQKSCKQECNMDWEDNLVAKGVELEV